MADKKILTAFNLSLFLCGQNDAEPCAQYEGSGDEWTSYLQIKQPGFDGYQTINLEGLWENVFSNYPKRVHMEVIGLETIVKYSDTQQFTEKFILVAELYYG